MKINKNLLLSLVWVALTLAVNPSHANEPLQFTPQAGFGGESQGNGMLKIFFGESRPFHVVSHGQQQGDGTFRLEQKVTIDGKPSEDRVWLLSTVGTDTYEGSLSDAAGPVSGYTTGRYLSLEYRVKGPLVMHQKMQILPDGKTIDNVGTVTLLGIPVAHLHETITRQEPAMGAVNASAPDASGQR